jgi:tetratricopeptide (TPR) repeat protein
MPGPLRLRTLRHPAGVSPRGTLPLDVTGGRSTASTASAAQTALPARSQLLRRFAGWLRAAAGPSEVGRADPAVGLAAFLDDGERRDRQLIELREQAFGPDHPDVASALHILAARYHLVHRYEQAEALYDRVLAIRSETLGRDHPATVEVLEDLGDLWRDRADRYRAARAYELALSAVTDPERRNRKRQDYNARLALLDPTTVPG